MGIELMMLLGLVVAATSVSTNERRYVRFDKQGLLRSCDIVDTRIADDAPISGVVISSISLSGESELDRVHKSPNGKPFPRHWGKPPLRQTRDLRPLPGDYGRGSSTFATWIEANLKRDTQNRRKANE